MRFPTLKIFLKESLEILLMIELKIYISSCIIEIARFWMSDRSKQAGRVILLAVLLKTLSNVSSSMSKEESKREHKKQVACGVPSFPYKSALECFDFCHSRWRVKFINVMFHLLFWFVLITCQISWIGMKLLIPVLNSPELLIMSFLVTFDGFSFVAIRIGNNRVK